MKSLSFKEYIIQPYPYYYEQRKLHKLSIIFILLCFFFTYFFEPFEVYRPEHKIHYVWICAIHSVLPALIGYGFFSILNFSFKQEENWTIGKEIMHVSMALLLIGIGSFLVRDVIYDNPDNWSVRYFLEEISHTFLVGLLFGAILVPLNFNRLFRKHQQEALKFRAPDISGIPAEELNEIIFIQTQVKGDDFHLNVSSFLFAKAAGNYVEIIIESEGQLTKLLKRISIKELEQQLSVYAWIIKTHRAYLVNTHRVKGIKGNVQGYLLTIDQYPEKVPVARGMVSAFDQFMNQQQACNSSQKRVFRHSALG